MIFRVITALVVIGILATSHHTSAQVPSPIWSKSFGGQGNQRCESIVVDDSGHIIISGYFTHSLDFGGGVLEHNDRDQDIFVAKFDKRGNHLWSKSFGDSSWAFEVHSGVDHNENIFVTGAYHGEVDFGGGPLPADSTYNVFLVKFDRNGDHIWSLHFGDSFYQVGTTVSTDSGGNVVVAGFFDGSIDFGGGPITCTTQEDIFLAKFDPHGTHLWSKSFGGLGNQYCWSVEIDGDDNIVIGGEFFGSVDFGGGGFWSGDGRNDFYLAKYDRDGGHLWSQSFGDSDNQFGGEAAIDGSNNVYFQGVSRGIVDFGGGPLTRVSPEDVVVAKFDLDGNHLWSKSFGGNAVPHRHDIEADDSGTIVFVGGFRDSANFGGEPLTSEGNIDVYIAKLDPDGNHVFSQRYGNEDYQWPNGVALNDLGAVYFVGDYSGSVDLGCHLHSNAYTHEDIFLASVSVGPLFSLECPLDATIPEDTSVITIPSFPLSGFEITNTFSDSLSFDYYLADTETCEAILMDNSDPASLFGTTPVLAPGEHFAPPEAAIEIPPLREHAQEYVTYYVWLHGCPGTADSCTTMLEFIPPLAVLVKKFEAIAVDHGVELVWEITSDENIKGFRIYRWSNYEDTNKILNRDRLIPSEETIYKDEGVRHGGIYQYTLSVVQEDGSEVKSQAITVETKARELVLDQNHPNPFNPMTTISFTLPEKAHANLSVFSVDGMLVKTLVNDVADEGFNEIIWNGTDARGNSVSSGVYFYRLKAGKQVLTRKMVVLK